MADFCLSMVYLLKYKVRHIWLLLFLSLANCKNKEGEKQVDLTPTTPILSYAIENTYPHDTNMFTEGLEFYEGNLYESSGSPNNLPFARSVIGVYDLNNRSGFDSKIEIDRSLFGEGITFLNDTLYQLTYTSHKGFIYNAKTFKKIKAFEYNNVEGWGLTNDGHNLIMSDGTDNLTYLNPQNFKVEKQKLVREGGNRRDSLNELEFVDGFVYANVWQTPYIIKIDTASGDVVGKFNLTDIVNNAKRQKASAMELNGIAQNPENGKMYVTGKLWPAIYQIDLGN